MKRSIALILAVSLAGLGGCAGTFGDGSPLVGRSTKISDASRVSAQNVVPDGPKYRRIAEHLALAEEVYAKQLDALRERRAQLRSRRRTLTLAAYVTFAATTLVISGAAIEASTDGEMSDDTTLRASGYGALGGLGLGTTLQVINFMQEDPANVEAKIGHLDDAYDNMMDRLKDLFEQAESQPDEGRSIELQTGPIIESFITDALQINIKG